MQTTKCSSDVSKIPVGTRRRFTKFILTHGHARDLPKNEEPDLTQLIPRMQLAVVTTSWWAQHETWQPNTQRPGPIATFADVLEYQKGLNRYTPTNPVNGRRMQHTVSIKLTPQTTREMLAEAEAAGVRTVKIYPAGVTNSKEGWTSFETDMYRPIGWALELDFIVCLHGEEPGDNIDTYAREDHFMERRFKKLVTDFPGGRFNVEHISRARTIEMVGEMPKNITGGLTIQHALATRNDLLEGAWKDKKGLDPRCHFRPPANECADMHAIRGVMFNAHRPAYQKFSFGPDSAPHKDCDKFCICGCPGAHVAPTLGPLIVDLYDRHGQLDSPALYAFTVQNGAVAFEIPIDSEQVFELVKEDWEMPEGYGGIATFFGGRKNSWRPVEIAALNPELLLKNN